MKRRLCFFIIAVVLAVFLAHCGGDKEPTDGARQRAKKAGAVPVRPDIDRVRIEPEAPTSNSIIEAVPVLKIERLQNVRFVYRWFVNSREIKEATRAVLPKNQYEKGNRVYCRVTAHRGSLSSAEKKSREAVVRNSPPVFKLKGVGPMDIPGRFTYQISAFDPDGDPLEYNLVSPLDRGIEVDPTSGLLEWYIERPDAPRRVRETREVVGEDGVAREQEMWVWLDDPNAPKYQRIAEITFEARDRDGGRTAATITLDLGGGKEVTY